MVKTILLPLDGSPLAERALPYALALARGSGATIVVVEAVHGDAPPGRDPRLPDVATVAHAHGSLSDVASRLSADGVKATMHVSHEDPVAAILDAAQLHRADLIVMSTHGRTGLRRMVYGSVADQVLRRAESPVLLVPATADHRWPWRQKLRRRPERTVEHGRRRLPRDLGRFESWSDPGVSQTTTGPSTGMNVETDRERLHELLDSLPGDRLTLAETALTALGMPDAESVVDEDREALAAAEEDPEKIGNALAGYRKREGWSQDDLAAFLGVTVRQLVALAAEVRPLVRSKQDIWSPGSRIYSLAEAHGADGHRLFEAVADRPADA